MRRNHRQQCGRNAWQDWPECAKRELRNFTQAIAGGKAPKSVVAEIAAREDRIAALEAERDQLARLPSGLSDMDRAQLRKSMQTHMGRLSDLLARDVPVARQVLSKLLVGPLSASPVVVDGRRCAWRV